VWNDRIQGGEEQGLWRGPDEETRKAVRAPVLATGMGAGGGVVDREGKGSRRRAGLSAWRARRESWRQGEEDKERGGKQVVHGHFRGHRVKEVYMCRLFVSNRPARILESGSPLDKT
jgi:hypothetical protein